MAAGSEELPVCCTCTESRGRNKRTRSEARLVRERPAALECGCSGPSPPARCAPAAVPAVRGRFLSFRFAANAMNILLAVDGSDCALRAARFLVRILEGAKAGEIHVVNVQAPLAYAEVLTAEQQTVVERSKRELGAQTAAGATDLLAAASLPCKLHVVVGEPGTAIAQLARQLGCELIVMGTRGMGAITGVVLGSVAAKVVHLADVPVTLVR